MKRAVKLLVGSAGSAMLGARAYGFRKLFWDSIRMRQSTKDSAACLRSLLPSDCYLGEDAVQRYLEELVQCDILRSSVDRHRDVIGKGYADRISGVGTAASLFCYSLLRSLRPEVVVETGCATGWTSALMLLALHHNQQGHLYSIDIPAVAGQLSMDWSLPQGLEPGFLVPDELRHRWTLILGNARTELVPLLQKLQKVDVFYHDSDHTYQHMMWEYSTAWPYLAQNGVLISDDIGWNTAFWDFATAMDRPTVIHRSNTNFGAIARS